LRFGRREAHALKPPRPDVVTGPGASTAPGKRTPAGKGVDMPRALPRFAAVVVAAVALTHFSVKPVDAQELAATAALLTVASTDATPGASPSVTPAGVTFAESASAPDFSRIRRPPVLPVLYATTALTQALDAHSTMTAMSRGAREANPVMQGVASNGGAIVAVKAGIAVGSIFVAEKMWRRNRAGAIATMVALNVVTAAVAAHNYRVASQLR
jgi:Domain of unknown function (DUF5658)